MTNSSSTPAQRDAGDGTAVRAPRRLAIIGAGNMGRALATGLRGAGLLTPADLVIADKNQAVAEALARDVGGPLTASNAVACAQARTIVLCVKPRDTADVLNDLMSHGALSHAPLLISIAAGVTLSALETATGHALPVIRAMPNMPCLIGAGMTVLSCGERVTAAQLAEARALFESVGRCMVLEERQLDAVTATSACGPAFAFLVLEALIEGGVQCGLPRAAATELVAQMMLGSAEMVLRTGTHPAALRNEVTTPAGCTMAGLLELEDGRVRFALVRAVEAAWTKAAELGR